MDINLVAHGIGGVRDLPVPTWLFYWWGSAVLIVSFVALGVLWRTPQLAPRSAGRAVSARLEAVALSLGAKLAVQSLSVFFFAVVFAAALAGDSDPLKNIAPTWVYVVFWLGVPLLSVLLGDVWRVLNPWRAIADAFVWAAQRFRVPTRPLIVYPARIGRWPAAVTLFAFTALELAYTDPSSPRMIGIAIAVYTTLALTVQALFGREVWRRSVDGFGVAFAYLARLAPLGLEDGRLRLRWPLTGATGREEVPGSLAVVAVMLGSVAFDGFSRTSGWQNLVADIRSPYVTSARGTGDLLVSLVSLSLLLGVIVFAGAAYRASCAIMRSTLAGKAALAPEFLLSLVPIAFVYAVAHYFSLFAIQIQFAIPQLSDPLGRGWNLLGTSDFAPNLAPFSPDTTWYVQVAALVVGHVAGLVLAHERAVTVFSSGRDAVRSQYAMLALMVLYTVGGLWLLSRG